MKHRFAAAVLSACLASTMICIHTQGDASQQPSSGKLKRKKHHAPCPPKSSGKKSLSIPEYIISLTSSAAFEALMFTQQQIPVVVKLGATWCGYCNRIQQQFYDTAALYRPGVDAVFAELTITDRPALGPTTLLTAFTKTFDIKITSIPAFAVLYKNETIVIQGSEKVVTIPSVLTQCMEQHPRLPSITQNSLKSYLQSSKKKPIVIKIHAFWCPPCSAMESIVDEVAQLYKDKIEFLRLDAVENPELTQNVMRDNNLSGYPAFLILHKGKVIETSVGMQTQEQLINKLKAVL